MLQSKRRIIGIDGFGGSGKTTFAKQLAEQLRDSGEKVLLLHLDDYITKEAQRYGTGFPEWHEYYYLQWDIDDIKSLLYDLSYNMTIKEKTLKKYDRAKDAYIDETISMENTTIIVEGVFLQREEWREFFDYVYFIDCDKELRLQRVCGRDTYIGADEVIIKKYEERYFPAEDYYQQKVKPEESANQVVKGF